ncbi:insulinase family protein [bacterium]|nr:insulinase family protein [bacterium]
MLLKRIMTFFALALVCVPVGLFASEELRPITLDNGLELYVFRDATVPLVRFQITFRTGAIVETEEYNGLSHLYEHMLFKANDKYQSQEEFHEAMNEMGCPEWNGGTAGEFVTYWATVPYSQFENIIAFWATTVRTNRFDPAELEKEKDVVINEIRMNQGDPQRTYRETVSQTMFPTYYSRKYVLGSIDVVRHCTIEQLEWLKKTYYVPNNCAVFISGDVTTEDAFRYVQKYFGDWLRADNPYEKYPVPKHPPIDKNKRIVVKNLPAPNFFMWDLSWRGPDVADEVEDTYPADILSFLIGRQSGRFMTALEPYLWQKEQTTFYYYTQRSGGVIGFNSPMLAQADPAENTKLVRNLKKAVFDELHKIATDPEYFSEEDIQTALSAVEAEQIYNNELISKKADGISFWWAVSSAEYYHNYLNNLKKVTTTDLASYVNRYCIDSHYVESFWINEDLANAMGLEDEL